jgi:hypothetical protein
LDFFALSQTDAGRADLPTSCMKGATAKPQSGAMAGRTNPELALRATTLLSLMILAVAASAARADPPYEARTAVGACLAAVIDDAPVVDGKGQDVALHRETSPNLCTVTVSGGDPADVRTAVMRALEARPERFTPARSAWAPGAWATREAFCNAPGRRALNVVVETAKPGAVPVATVTVIEGKSRDRRCDLDFGVQAP